MTVCNLCRSEAVLVTRIGRGCFDCYHVEPASLSGERFFFEMTEEENRDMGKLVPYGANVLVTVAEGFGANPYAEGSPEYAACAQRFADRQAGKILPLTGRVQMTLTADQMDIVETLCAGSGVGPVALLQRAIGYGLTAMLDEIEDPGEEYEEPETAAASIGDSGPAKPDLDDGLPF